LKKQFQEGCQSRRRTPRNGAELSWLFICYQSPEGGAVTNNITRRRVNMIFSFIMCVNQIGKLTTYTRW